LWRFIAPCKTLTDRGARDIHELTFKVVIRRNFGADIDQVVGADAELGQLALGRTLALAKCPRIGAVTRFAFAVPAPS
jgi:hypothetical protein